MDFKINDIIRIIENAAPLPFSESYDNSGLICGHPDWQATGALLCLDSTEPVIDEAIHLGCNLVIAHHPILFSGIKKITGRDYVERALIRAIKNDIAIYAAHTNLDNVILGVNRKIGGLLGLKNLKILQPKRRELEKLVTFCPKSAASQVLDALFAAGAGNIGNYSECSFALEGTGSFKGNEDSNPFVGQAGKRHYEPETRIEVIFEKRREADIMLALRSSHPYEEIAYYLTLLENEYQTVGSGMVGETEQAVSEIGFLEHLSKAMNLQIIRHTRLNGREVKRVAVCGGAGSFLIKDALRADCQFFITSDLKYHQFFDAEDKIVIADIGHYESERFTCELLFDLIRKNLPTFALHLTKQVTNPVNYYIRHDN